MKLTLLEDLTEKEALTKELVSTEDTPTADADSPSKQQDNGRRPQKESDGKSKRDKKRNSEKNGSPKRRMSGQRCAQLLIDFFLRENSDADRSTTGTGTPVTAAANERRAFCSVPESDR